MVSLMLLVSVDGPALVTTSVKLVVPPTATVEEPTVLLGLMLTVGTTSITAVTVAELVPTEVVKDPDAMVLVAVPLTELVTTDVMVQVEAGGMTVFTGKVSDPAAGVADTRPPLQPTVVVTTGVVFTNPKG